MAAKPNSSSSSSISSSSGGSSGSSDKTLHPTASNATPNYIAPYSVKRYTQLHCTQLRSVNAQTTAPHPTAPCVKPMLQRQTLHPLFCLKTTNAISKFKSTYMASAPTHRGQSEGLRRSQRRLSKPASSLSPTKTHRGRGNADHRLRPPLCTRWAGALAMYRLD